jgi:hypothetical protein
MSGKCFSKSWTSVIFGGTLTTIALICEHAINGRAPNAQGAGDVGDVLAAFEHNLSLASLDGRERRSPSKALTATLSRRKPRDSPLAHDVVFEFRDRAKDRVEHLPGRCAGVNMLGQRPQRYPALRKVSSCGAVTASDMNRA